MEQKLRRDLNMGQNLGRLRTIHKISQERLCAELQRRGCDIGRSTYAKYEVFFGRSKPLPYIARNGCCMCIPPRTKRQNENPFESTERRNKQIVLMRSADVCLYFKLRISARCEVYPFCATG